ncbi:MAG TPA: glycosyltransferase, partial [Nitrospira sp.]
LVLMDRVGRVAFVLRKLDYALWLVHVAMWVWRRRPRALHLVLGGAYLALPIQLIGIAPPAVLSVVCPNLREMVGSRLALPLYRLALRFAARVDALTESVRRMVEAEGVMAEQIYVPTGSCVDTQRFRTADKEPWVVFCGRLIPDKGPMLFMRASGLVCDRMKGRLPNLRIFLLGEGPLRAEIDAQVEERGLGQWMQVGWNEHVESVLSHAVVFVSLQRIDNYPSQALLEAMASCAAVVATDVGLTRKLVDEQVGRLVRPDPESVAQAIISLLDDPIQTAAMGRRARERVVQQHSLERYLDYIQNVYATVG